jgi:rhamnogalacturonyl hydrolase YesR
VSTITPGQVGETVERTAHERAVSAAYALMAYWWYRWDWGEAAGFDGIAAISGAADWSVGRDYVTRELRLELERHASGKPASIHAPCRCMFQLADQLGCDAVDGYLDDVTSELGATATSAPERLYFVDSLYTDPSLLVEVGEARADPELVSRGVSLALAVTQRLQDDRTGLLFHFRDDSVGLAPRVDWGRGNGWGAAGLADLLAVLPAGAHGQAELAERFTHLADALIERQDPTGAWRNLVSASTSYPEASATALIVVALTEGVALGVLGSAHAAAAERGWTAIEHRIDCNGHLVGASARPGLQADPVRYEHVATAGVFPWGNGPYLRALAQRHSRHPRQEGGEAR